MSRSLLWLLSVVQLTLLLDFMWLMPLGPQLLRSLDISAAGFGWAVSAYTLASALAGLCGFFWIDSWPRRPALLLLYAAFVGATLGCGTVSTLVGLITARVLAGASAGLLWSIILALIVDSVPEQQRGGAMALVMTSYSVSAVAGVPLGLLLADTWTWRVPFWVLAGSAVAVWFALERLLPHAPRRVQPNLPAAPAPAFEPAWMLGWLLSFAVVFAGFLLIPYLGTFLVNNLRVSTGVLAWLYLFGGLATFGSLRLVGRLVDRYGPLRVLSGLLPLAALSHWSLAHLHTASLPVAACLFVSFMALTSGRVIPTVVLISSRVPARSRGRFLAVNTAATDAASGLATWFSGALLGTSPGGALIGFGRIGTLAVLAAAFALLVSWRIGQRAPLSESDFENADALEGAE